MPEPADQLAAYLATHHAPCPGCAFDLHGLTSPTCPECGTAITLEVRRSDFAARHARLIVVAGAVMVLGSVLSVVGGVFVVWNDPGLPRAYTVLRGADVLAAAVVAIVLGTAIVRVVRRKDRADRAHAALLTRTLWIMVLNAIIGIVWWAFSIFAF